MVGHFVPSYITDSGSAQLRPALPRGTRALTFLVHIIFGSKPLPLLPGAVVFCPPPLPPGAVLRYIVRVR